VGDRRSPHRARRGKPDDGPDAADAASADDAAASADDAAASADDPAAASAADAAETSAEDLAATSTADAAETSADDLAAPSTDHAAETSAAPAHDRAGAPDDHAAGALADDRAAPHHDPAAAPVSAAAHAHDHAGSAESHHDHRAHRRARGADDRTARGPGRPPADAAAAGSERPAVGGAAGPGAEITTSEIEVLLQRYAKAWRGHDVEELRRIGQVTSDVQAAALRDYFARVEDLDVEVQLLSVQPRGDHRTVRFTRRDRFRDPLGRLVTQETAVEKDVARTASGLRFVLSGP